MAKSFVFFKDEEPHVIILLRGQVLLRADQPIFGAPDAWLT